MAVLRVATFNIRRGLGRDKLTDLERTAAAIRATDASVIALQEIDVQMTRSGRVDQRALLEELTGMQIEFWPTITRGAGQYGIGLALRDGGDAEFHRLPRLAREEPRGAILSTNGGIAIIATHLSTNGPARSAQIGSLVALAAELQQPVIILGDMNASRRALNGLQEAGFDAGRRIVTFPGKRRRQIDYILAGPGLRLLKTWTIDTAASDHLPLVGELEPN
jgi:endonuclease/exonuclease/phosphatase family metal-dependent hydrolase